MRIENPIMFWLAVVVMFIPCVIYYTTRNILKEIYETTK